MILVDTAFASVEFLHGVRKLKYHTIAGVRCDRQLVDGRSVADLYKRGQQVRLVGRRLTYHYLPTRIPNIFVGGEDLSLTGGQIMARFLQGLNFPVSVSWYYLKRDNGKLEKRFVLSTKPLRASTITWWGKRRWQIEGWFKTAKHREGLHRFGQATLLGVYRWLILSLIAYILAHWAYLSTATTDLPDWGQAAQIALESILPQLLLFVFLLDLERIIPLARSHGFDIHFSRCKM